MATQRFKNEHKWRMIIFQNNFDFIEIVFV